MSSADNKAHYVYILFAAGVLVLAMAGYAGYVLYPRFDLPAASGTGLLVLATAAGMASFFSPCSFPLLVTLLTRSIDAQESGSALRSALQFGVSLALGASAFLLITGVGIALGAEAFFEEVTFTSSSGRILRIVVGTLLLILGLVQIGVFSFPFGKIAELGHVLQKQQARLHREHPTLAFGLLGFGYILAGFG